MPRTTCPCRHRAAFLGGLLLVLVNGVLAAGCSDSPTSGDGGADGAAPADDLSAGDLAVVPGADLAEQCHPDHQNTLRWARQCSGVDADLYYITGSDASHIYVAGGQSTMLFSSGDGSWSRQTTGLPDSMVGSFNGLYAPARDLIFATYHEDPRKAVGSIFRSTGDGSWSQEADLKQPFVAVSGSGRGPIFTVGSTTDGNLAIRRRAGAGSWKDEGMFADKPGSFQDIFVAAANAIYAVGEGDGFSGVIYFSTGDGNWASQDLPAGTDALYGIWGSSPTDLYAVGKNATVLHSRGDGTWDPVTVPANQDLAAIWGSGPDDIYAVGQAGILHRTGDGKWHAVKTGIKEAGNRFLLGVWGSGPQDVYVTADRGLILHYGVQ